MAFNFKIVLTHRPKQLDDNLYKVSHLFEGYFIDINDKVKIDQCLKLSTTLYIYGETSLGAEIVSAVNFAIHHDGLYVNWLATANTNFSKKIS